jgi:hypothetical protein
MSWIGGFFMERMNKYKKMVHLKHSCNRLFFCGLGLLLLWGLAGCQQEVDRMPPAASQLTQAVPVSQQETGPLDPSPEASPTETRSPLVEKVVEVDIEAAWQASSHASSFVVDANGNNNSCARCHAPSNWMPSMDDLPESCYTCKFQLEDPPPFIAEDEWTHIACQVCHTVDKKKNIQAEVAWLEIPALGEYTPVVSNTELCQKCHLAGEVAGHRSVEVGGAHAELGCTDCHPAHSTSASCSAAGCHPEALDPTAQIPGHDDDHNSIACAACHDAGGLSVGPVEEDGMWTTFTAGAVAADLYPFTSHNIVLEAPCTRCHFEGNPWSLSIEAASP